MKERIKEIESQLTSLGKEKYAKKELLSQMLALQNEIVCATFNEDHAQRTSLRLWDVEKHLTQLNEGCGNVADELLASFIDQSKQLSEKIKGEFSGAKGENKALKSLQTNPNAQKILRNIELASGDHRTEIDLVVITKSAIFLLEVKNTAKDIVIDEKGNYCRKAYNGDLVFDKNIGEKMNEKEYLLREALKIAGVENVNMHSLVVFTNSSINVTNNYKYITECYLSQLPHIVANTQDSERFSEREINKVAQIILSAQSKDEYYVDMNIEKFKNTFATLMATLEKAKAEQNEKVGEKTRRSNPFARFFKRIACATALMFN